MTKQNRITTFQHAQIPSQPCAPTGGPADFVDINVTGLWAEANRAGGYRYVVSNFAAATHEWIAFEGVELKVAQGRTQSGILYLNFYVKHLGRAGFAVGGLLGEDDHTEAMTPPAGCAHHVALAESSGHARSTSSVAVAETMGQSNFGINCTALTTTEECEAMTGCSSCPPLCVASSA